MSGDPGAIRASQGRLRWRCRRGMREMDLLLNDFLDRAYADLDGAGQALFARLLELPDPHLHALLSGRERHPEPAMQALIGAITAFGSKRRATPPAC